MCFFEDITCMVDFAFIGTSSDKLVNWKPNSLFPLPTWTSQDCLILSVSAVWTQLHTRQDSFVLSRSSFDEFCLISTHSNLQLFSLKYIEYYWNLGNWKLGRDKTKLSWRTRQFCLVHVGGVNKLTSWPSLTDNSNVRCMVWSCRLTAKCESILC